MEAGPGSVVEQDGRGRAYAGRSTPRRPGAALRNVLALTGGGGSRLARVRVCPLPALPRLTRAKSDRARLISWDTGLGDRSWKSPCLSPLRCRQSRYLMYN